MSFFILFNLGKLYELHFSQYCFVTENQIVVGNIADRNQSDFQEMRGAVESFSF